MPTVGHPLRLLARRMASWECDPEVDCPPECGVSSICSRQIQFYTDELMALSAALTATARADALKEAEKKMTEMATSCDVVGDPDADVFRCAAEAIAAAAVKPGEPNVGAPIPDLTGGEGGAPDENVE